jgi:hypothetical protein
MATTGGNGPIGNGSAPLSWKAMLRGPLRITQVNIPADTAPVDPADPLEMGARLPASWIQWSQRLLRWNAGTTDGEGTTAWVRDYSLDPSDVPGLLASLRAVSEQQGLTLHRIMINGHEAWTSPDTSHLTGRDA